MSLSAHWTCSSERPHHHDLLEIEMWSEESDVRGLKRPAPYAFNLNVQSHPYIAVPQCPVPQWLDPGYSSNSKDVDFSDAPMPTPHVA